MSYLHRQTGLEEIKALTGLRGVAAFYVMLFHLTANGQLGRGHIRTLMSHGYLAVDLFFVLSGFVMAMAYGPQFVEEQSLRSYGAFLIKRLARVYPLFLVATLVCAVLSLLDPAQEGALSGLTLASNVVMAQSLGLSSSLDYPGWSISTEFAAYLLFPIFVALFLRRAWLTTLLSSLVSLLLLVFVATRTSTALHELCSRIGPLDVWSSDTLFPVLRCVAGFSLGLAAWRTYRSARLGQMLRSPVMTGMLPLMTIGLLCIAQADVVFVVTAAALIVSLTQETSLPARVLAWAPIYWLGKVSYSLYLIHYPASWAVSLLLRQVPGITNLPFHGAALKSTVIILSLGLAATAYRYIEQPGQRLVRSILRSSVRLPATVRSVPSGT